MLIDVKNDVGWEFQLAIMLHTVTSLKILL